MEHFDTQPKSKIGLKGLSKPAVLKKERSME